MVCFVSVPSSNEEPSADPPSPLSAKRRVLSRSALQSHQPVARPVAMGLSRYGAARASGIDKDTELLILSVWLSNSSCCDVLKVVSECCVKTSCL